MTREAVIRHLCHTVAIAYASRRDFSKPSDCFCSDRPGWSFQHAGESLAFVREAVKEKLVREGFTVVEPHDWD